MRNNSLAEAWALMESVTPLSADCGEVCGGRCCRPSAESQGMLLFPGEERLLEDAGYILKPAQEGVLLTCDGTCDRARRPLQCRFFPLFPHVDENGRVRAVYDPRGWRLCPLISQCEHVPLQREFVRAVRRAGRILMADPACAAFLRRQSEEIDELDRLLRLKDKRSPIMRRKIHG